MARAPIYWIEHDGFLGQLVVAIHAVHCYQNYLGYIGQLDVMFGRVMSKAYAARDPVFQEAVRASIQQATEMHDE